MMGIRRTIARWLCPEAFEQERRHWYLRQKLSEAADWLSNDFPVVDAVIHWAKVAEVNHFRALDAPSIEAVPGKPWVHEIHDFREHLRSNHRATPSPSPTNPLNPEMG